MKFRIILATCLIVAGGTVANFLRYFEQQPDRPADFGEIPYTANNYVGEERRFSEASYDVLMADTTILRLYLDDTGQPYWLFIGYFASQQYGSQIHSPKNCLPGGGWRIEELQPYTLILQNGLAWDVNRLTISEKGGTQLMLYWFETRGGDIRSEFDLKWDLMLNSLMFQPTDAAFIRLTTPIMHGEDLNTATARAVAFLDTFYPAIQRALPFSH